MGVEECHVGSENSDLGEIPPGRGTQRLYSGKRVISSKSVMVSSLIIKSQPI